MIDAFAVHLPIYYRAISNAASPWWGKIEILPGNLSLVPEDCRLAVAARPSGYRLLAAVEEILAVFMALPERSEIECRWQSQVLAHRVSYRDESSAAAETGGH